MQKKVFLNSNQIDIIINRLVCQLIENHNDFNDTVLIGLQPRGIYLLDKILDVFSKKHTNKKIIHRNLDYTFSRDLLIRLTISKPLVVFLKFIFFPSKSFINGIYFL